MEMQTIVSLFSGLTLLFVDGLKSGTGRVPDSESSSTVLRRDQQSLKEDGTQIHDHVYIHVRIDKANEYKYMPKYLVTLLVLSFLLGLHWIGRNQASLFSPRDLAS